MLSTREGIQRATSTPRNVEGAWVKDMNVLIQDGSLTGYKANVAITFVLWRMHRAEWRPEALRTPPGRPRVPQRRAGVLQERLRRKK